MAVEQTTHGFGTKVKIGAYDPNNPETAPADGSFTEFGELVSCSLGSLKVTRVNATRLNQTDRYMRRKPGFVDPGEPTFKIHFKKADYNTLLGYVTNGTELWWSFELPEPDSATNTNKLRFHGFVGDLAGEVPEDEGISVDVTLVVNGKPQFTAYA